MLLRCCRRLVPLALAVFLAAGCRSPGGEGRGPASFAYVLQADRLCQTHAAAVAALAACDRDLLVLDVAYSGGADGRWTAEELARIRAARPGRRILGYLSIGEAEDYRPYWQPPWDANRDGQPDPGAPAWLGAENPNWKGNYVVRYWQPQWQELILADLAALQRQGFDGVYLDIVDGYLNYEYHPDTKEWEGGRINPQTKRSYRRDMIAWVGRVAAQARARQPGFLVFSQNALDLLDEADYRGLIDGLGVESFASEYRPQARRAERERFLKLLDLLAAEGKPVLFIEYARKGSAERRFAQDLARQHRFLLLFADKQLTHLGEVVPRP